MSTPTKQDAVKLLDILIRRWQRFCTERKAAIRDHRPDRLGKRGLPHGRLPGGLRVHHKNTEGYAGKRFCRRL